MTATARLGWISSVAAVRSEGVRFWSLRAPAVLVVAVVVVTGAFAALMAFAQARQWDGGAFDPARVSLAGIMMTQIAAGALGVLAFTTETASGTIRSTLAAIPRRSRVLTAKIVTVGLAAMAAGIVAAFTAFLIARPVLRTQGAPVAALTDPGVFRAVLGAAFYLTAAALVGLALGVLTGSTAASLSIMTGVLLIVPIFIPTLPAGLARWAMKYWPSTAGLRVTATAHDPALLAPWAGFAVLAATTATLLAVAFLALHRRDV
ncbi:hypothetical protein [Actinoplanes derwentensis]|uniref:ABC-2 family transporter protein n=1 Tax=Actinoplanes derwentensis TaxID=113562 RepID=A0A1H1QF04_9ACTN|nr:hypothetical protein [Actinoplanes derwentensis]GID82152.1 ABC transporter permease [Actinoplanes derwentensis]SDS22141.1 hypothetical protein SAMN04489716_0289 [Actinoplanes derwentensis]